MCQEELPKIPDHPPKTELEIAGSKQLGRHQKIVQAVKVVLVGRAGVALSPAGPRADPLRPSGGPELCSHQALVDQTEDKVR
uniref:Uncharacterized protein n=1 Tax=Knipowitschia caucasica TaxID=637954 RepID=A0AAV2L6T1_KNICA